MLSMIPRLIGHRGAKESAPENTLASIREAAAQGAPWIEFDVMLTRDGAAVVIHDDTLDRTTNGRGPMNAIDREDLRRLDAGSWFDSRFAGERVPDFTEALDLAKSLGLGINVEIKPFPGQEVATAETVVSILQRHWPDNARLLVSSFEVPSLDTVRRLAPTLPLGYLLWDPPADWAGIADRLRADTLNVDQERQTADTVAAYRATGRPVLAYTVNDAERAADLFAWGVSAVFTDAPGRLGRELGVL